MQMIYLDHAAATPLDADVLSSMLPYFSQQFFNPSAMYQAATEVRSDIEHARQMVARVLGVRPAEIFFTAGGTEANNLAIRGVMDEVLQRNPNATVLTTAIEHDSVLHTVQFYNHTLLPVSADGIVHPEVVERAIDDNTALISVMYANNEIGSVQPLRNIGQIVQNIRKDRRTRGVDMPLYFHTDAAQAGNYLDLQVSRLGVDLLTLNGGKIYGPKQSGILYVAAGLVLAPQITGGGQESNIRSGTENVPGIIGFAAALHKAQNMRSEESRRLADLQAYFFKAILQKLPRARINGSQSRRLPNNLHLTFPGVDNERLIYQLDEAGMQAAAGSACSASSEQSSHVLLAIGLTDEEARSSLRLTMGRGTTKAELDTVIETLQTLINKAET